MIDSINQDASSSNVTGFRISKDLHAVDKEYKACQANDK
jgi:hypothetical protein